jgi:hypothetical protein
MFKLQKHCILQRGVFGFRALKGVDQGEGVGEWDGLYTGGKIGGHDIKLNENILMSLKSRPA